MMKLVVTLSLFLFSLNAWSSRFSSSRKTEGQRPGNSSTSLRNLNSRASQILGTRIRIVIDRKASPQQMRVLEDSYKKLLDRLDREARKDVFSNSQKRQEIAQILNSMNMGFATRSNLVDFIGRNGSTENIQRQRALTIARDLVDIIDNSFNILLAKIKDGYKEQSIVDGTKINSIFEIFGQVNGRFNAQMVIDLANKIESHFNYSEGLFQRSEILQKIARCR